MRRGTGTALPKIQDFHTMTLHKTLALFGALLLGRPDDGQGGTRRALRLGLGRGRDVAHPA